MKTKNLSRNVIFLVLLLVVAFASSCNRGYGCPTNFSLDLIGDAVRGVLAWLQ